MYSHSPAVNRRSPLNTAIGTRRVGLMPMYCGSMEAALLDSIKDTRESLSC